MRKTLFSAVNTVLVGAVVVQYWYMYPSSYRYSSDQMNKTGIYSSIHTSSATDMHLLLQYSGEVTLWLGCTVYKQNNNYSISRPNSCVQRYKISVQRCFLNYRDLFRTLQQGTVLVRVHTLNIFSDPQHGSYFLLIIKCTIVAFTRALLLILIIPSSTLSDPVLDNG